MGGEGRSGKFVSTLIGSEYDVIDVFRTVIKNAPYGKYAAPSQYQIGLYLSEKGLLQEARDEFEKVINELESLAEGKLIKKEVLITKEFLKGESYSTTERKEIKKLPLINLGKILGKIVAKLAILAIWKHL